MRRDTEIEGVFTTADDAIQGLWALHMYLKAAADIADGREIARNLPQQFFQLTHHWKRFYDTEELVAAIRETGIDFLLCRASLVSLVAISEAALDRMNAHLKALRHCRRVKGNKSLLKWAFGQVKGSQSGSPQMLNRLPETCGDLDNARRLRNCIAHNNGKYNNQYLEGAIDDGWVIIQKESAATCDMGKRSVIQLTTARYEKFSRSHIEFLHILHNTIQGKFFGHRNGYTYADEGKNIEWHRVLVGREDVGL